MGNAKSGHLWEAALRCDVGLAILSSPGNSFFWTDLCINFRLTRDAIDRQKGAVVRNSSCVGTAGCPNGYPGCTVIALAVADAWDGEYTIIGGPQVPFQQEDPHVYKTKRGFHAVYHGM